MNALVRNILVLLILVTIYLGLEILELFMLVEEDLAVGSAADDDVDRVLGEIFLHYADELDADGLRKLLLLSTMSPNIKDSRGGALFRIVNRGKESDAMMEALEVLLQHPDTDPNGTGNHWPTLKVAIAKGHERVVRRLLKHPRTKRTIHPSGLSCETFERLPEEVSLSLDRAAPECAKRHPRYNVDGARQSGQSVETAKKSPLDVKRSHIDVDAANPFQPVAPGQMPPRELYVMNPEAFDNILDALRYYIFGKPWGGLELTTLVSLVAVQTSLAFFVISRA